MRTRQERTLYLTMLDGQQPKTKQDLGEALDSVLLEWFDYLADNDIERVDIGDKIVDILEPYLYMELSE